MTRKIAPNMAFPDPCLYGASLLPVDPWVPSNPPARAVPVYPAPPGIPGARELRFLPWVPLVPVFLVYLSLPLDPVRKLRSVFHDFFFLVHALINHSVL